MSRASKTLVEFAEQMARVAPAVEPFGAYVSARTRVECRCRACGHLRSPYPKGMPQGGTCPGCAKRAATQRHAQAHERQER